VFVIENSTESTRVICWSVREAREGVVHL